MYIKHKFQTAKGDGPDSTRVRPTAWNDDHDFWVEDGVIIGRPPGSGDGPAMPIPIGSVFSPGIVVPYAGPTAPAGWFICDGRSLVRADNLQLYLVIGTLYGQGSVPGSTFAIPNLMGRTIAMVDPSGTVLTTASMAPNGNTLGGYGGQQSEQVHLGGIPVYVNGGGLSGYVNGNVHSHGPDSAGTLGNGTGATVGYAPDGHGHHIPTHGLQVIVNGGQAGGAVYNGYYTPLAPNCQPTMLMNYMIKG
jgi:microcystin-dependent protein